MNSLLASVVIPVLDDTRIRRCVESVIAQTLTIQTQYEVIVVDNNSKKVDILALLHDLPVRLLIEKRPGICAAVNRGLKEASGEFLVRTDADCIVATDWLEELLAPFSDPEVGAVGGAIHKQSGDSLIEAASRNLVIGDQLEPQFLPMFDAPYVVTANAAYRLELIKELGGFDEQLFSGGDVDISWRISLEGFRIVTTKAAVAYHPARPSISKYFQQFFTYALGHVLLFKKYRAITGKRVLFNTYPLEGALRVLFKDVPRVLKGMLGNGSLNRVQSMRLLLNLVEYTALTCGYVVGSIRYRVPYL